MQLFTGKQYLKIDIANSFGLDKEDWDVRLSWFDANESRLHSLINKSEEPALMYAGIQAWEKAKDGHASGYPISLDATASGIQHLSLLTGDRKAATACNLISSDGRKDVYKQWYEAMVRKIAGKAIIDRKDTKKAIMTAFYNSEATPKRVFGEGELLEQFYRTMEEEAPGAWELNMSMRDLWDPERDIYEWVMPDNFHVKCKVMAQRTESVKFMDELHDVHFMVNAPTPTGRSLGANSTHACDSFAVREVVGRCDFDPEQLKRISGILSGTKDHIRSHESDKMVRTLWEHYQDSGFLSVHILDFLNSGNFDPLMQEAVEGIVTSMPKKPFKILTIHDAFRCLPNYGNDLRKQYNQVMSDIGRSELLRFLLSQIAQRIINVRKLDYDMWKDVKVANYALS